jgi:hypothetical protein
MSDKNRDLSAQPLYPVVVDPTPYATLTAEERKRLEDDAIQRIQDLHPPEHRQIVARDLGREQITATPAGFTIRQLAGSSHPEIARLLSVLASIRAADAAEQPQASASMAPSQQGPPEKRIIITVAIDNSATNAVAIVRPDYGLPILVLPPSADEATVRAGTRTLRDLIKDFGPQPVREFRAEVARTDRDGPSGKVARLMANIRENGRTKSIPGVGEGLLALEISTRAP